MDFKVFDTTKIDEYSKRAKEQWGQTSEYKEFEEMCIRDSGKSTVANLIARFFDVTKGSIRIGGKDIRQLNPDGLLQYISEAVSYTHLDVYKRQA